MNPPGGLDRSLGLTHATAMVVGIIIGASIFVQPSEITRQMPSAGGVLLVWLAAGVLTLFGSLVCAELASAFPRTGGVYVFLKEAYSPVLGFLWGWAMFWSMHTGIIAAIAMVFARYTAHFLPMNDPGLRLTAVALIVVLSAINYMGVRYGGRVQSLFTGAKVLALAALVAVGLFGSAPRAVSQTAAGTVTGQGFVLALVAGLFAYGGWHMVTYAAGETRDAARTIPRALLLGTLIVTACYAGLNAVYLRVLPLEAARASTRVAADAADALLGGGGASLMAALVMVSTFGAVNGVILAGPRVYYSMAEDGLLFRWLGATHPRFQTPHRAVTLQALLASLLALTDSYRALFTRVIYTEWIFFALMAAGLFRLRRRPDYRPAYRVWGHPAVPVLFVLASAVIVAVQIVSQPRDSAVGLGIVLLGLPIYYLWHRP
ncbi:MAG TPA: amino acid permease [Thermoanaerobaculia bacterium]|jgi:APA family basic amino acid/polyamine antiporter|nr:amino acid permease [Thermoanaerobaculia bacterium]